ncbi:SDR family oxidoreductase [Cyclobacterium roseum]|uniref:SDR family oxidoreductase n=1 Tax=Cyclobacterium roseum TaxID=2666137 RepID=UPI001390C178|nr:SDR family oxidoreductase [Cyclobacterium roseum]
MIRHLLPPHADNEQASEYLRLEIGAKDPHIEWVVVRPDSLIDQSEVTAYQAFPSPTRSALFNPGKTSRIHVGNFMARLLVENELWEQWKGQMPVLYNRA